MRSRTKSGSSRKAGASPTPVGFFEVENDEYGEDFTYVSNRCETTLSRKTILGDSPEITFYKFTRNGGRRRAYRHGRVVPGYVGGLTFDANGNYIVTTESDCPTLSR